VDAADQKGVRAGDVVVANDGVSTEGLLPKKADLTMGEIGSNLTLMYSTFWFRQPNRFEIKRSLVM